MGSLATKPILMTVEEYRRMPEDNRKVELIRGELYMSPAPTPYHQWISSNIEFYLRTFLLSNPSGVMFHAPFDVFFNEDTALQPDIIYFSNEKMEQLDGQGFNGPPDLVVEILSPGTSKRDLTEKRHLFHEYLIKEIWYVSPKHRTVEVERLGASGYEPARLLSAPVEILTSPLLPGFELTLEKVFSSPFPAVQ